MIKEVLAPDCLPGSLYPLGFGFVGAKQVCTVSAGKGGYMGFWLPIFVQIFFVLLFFFLPLIYLFNLSSKSLI